MTLYNVHLYREMRLVFEGISAETPEAAAAIARDKPTDESVEIADCEGETLSALVDVDGGENRTLPAHRIRVRTPTQGCTSAQLCKSPITGG